MPLVVPSMSVRRVVMLSAMDRAEPRDRTLGRIRRALLPGTRCPARERVGSAGVLPVTRELLRDVGAGEVADPAVGLLEEADRDEARLGPHVEPVGGAVGH